MPSRLPSLSRLRFVFCLALVGLWVRVGEAQTLSDLPPLKRDRGNAFVNAWLVLRGELDALSATKAHPALLDAWVDRLPEPVLVDMLRLATEPRTILAMADKLSRSRKAADQEELVLLQTSTTWQGLADRLVEIRVRGGDRDLASALRIELESEAPVVRLRAAERLGCAGDRAGLLHLRKALASKREAAITIAARALARCGLEEDKQRLRHLAATRSQDPIALAALGEFLTRFAFPWHYNEMTKRDAAFVHERTPGGTLDTWYACLGRVIEQGTSTGSQVPRALLALIRSGPIFEESPEVFLRRVTSLSDTWSTIEASLSATASTPQWPSRLASALGDLVPVSPQSETPGDRAKRVAAAVALLHTLSGNLGYEKISRGLEVVALSPGLERALDRNFATAARLLPGHKVVFDLGRPTAIRELHLSTACAIVEGSQATSIRISPKSDQAGRPKQFQLEPNNRYFQKINLEFKPTDKLEIELLEVSGKGPACFSELRLR